MSRQAGNGKHENTKIEEQKIRGAGESEYIAIDRRIGAYTNIAEMSKKRKERILRCLLLTRQVWQVVGANS